MPDRPQRKFLIAIAVVAMLNFSYFWVESGAAWSIKSVSLFADSVDFLKDTALNVLILLGFNWSGKARGKLGTVLAGLLVIPGLLTLWSALSKIQHPLAPDPRSLGLVGFGALVVNVFCAFYLVRFRDYKGSLTQAAFL